MKRSYVIYVVFLVAYFLLISIYKSLQFPEFTQGWFRLEFLVFWVGGLIGVFLPDVDHLIYLYALRPHELTSKRVDSLLRSRNYGQTLKLLAQTSEERKELIFHNAPFQMIFWVFVFLVVTSGGSLFGLGLVLGFALHLTLDYAMIIVHKEDPGYWFRKINIKLTDSQYGWYLMGNILLLVVFGLF